MLGLSVVGAACVRVVSGIAICGRTVCVGVVCGIAVCGRTVCVGAVCRRGCLCKSCQWHSYLW